MRSRDRQRSLVEILTELDELELDYIAVRLGTLQALGLRVAAGELARMSGLSISPDEP